MEVFVDFEEKVGKTGVYFFELGLLCGVEKRAVAGEAFVIVLDEAALVGVEGVALVVNGFYAGKKRVVHHHVVGVL